MEFDEQELMKFTFERALEWKNKLKLPDDAEDIRQSVCMKLWEAGKWPCEEALIAVTTKNHCLDLKRKPVYEEVPLEERDAPVVEASMDRQQWLDTALREFTWTEQKAVRLRLQGLTLHQIGKEVSMHPESLRRLLDKTAQNLNKIWEKEG